MRIKIFFILLFFMSCSTLKKMAMIPAGKVFYKASIELQVEKDWDSFEGSILANIKMIESLYFQFPKNKDLQVALLKAYFAKAFGVDETKYLQDHFLETENSKLKIKALKAYTKAFNIGLDFLNSFNIKTDNLEKYISDLEGFKNKLEQEIPSTKRNLEGVLFTAQAIASLINLQKDNIKILIYLSISKIMSDWVCEKDPGINFGMCDIFYASCYSSRPRMLGGNPQKGREIFLFAMKKYPENLLIAQSYIQYYLLPMLKKDEYMIEKNKFEKRERKFENSMIWKGEKIDNRKNFLNFFNMIGIKRMNIIKSLEHEFF